MKTRTVEEVVGERWECRERMGASSIAALYRGVDRETGSPVHVRLVHRHLSDRDLVRSRFRREVGALGAIDSDHVVGLLATGESEDRLYAVTESFAGTNLEGLLAREGKLDRDRAIGIARDVLAALEAAHEVGLVHRDVHPRHIWPATERGTVLGGFGMAKVQQIVSLTTHSTAVGRADYAAPERFDAAAIDGRADLYSVGVVLYEMLTGRLPPEGGHRRCIKDAFGPDVGGQGPSPASRLADVVVRATALEPEKRFRTAQSMRTHLESPASSSLDEPPLEHCPECGTPLLEGVERCLECGHRTGRIVQRPGEGTWRVVIPKHPSQLLTGSQGDLDDARWHRLMDAVDEAGLELTWTSWRESHKRRRPIHLAADLTRDDATRLRDFFVAHDVPVESRNDADRRCYLETLLEAAPVAAQLAGFLPLGAIILVVAGSKAGAAPGRIVALFGLVIAVVVGVGGAGLLHRCREQLAPVLDVEASEMASDHGLPEEILEAAAGAVTARTRGVWVEFASAWQEVQGVVESTAARAMDRLLESAVDTVGRMRALEEKRQAISVVDIVDAVDALDTRIEDAEEPADIDRMIDRKATLEQRLESADELDRRIAKLREALLDCTDRMRSLAQRDDTPEPKVVLPQLADELEEHHREASVAAAEREAPEEAAVTSR